MPDGPWILDASAVLALLREEPGHRRVAELLRNARMSTVNVAEVIVKLVDAGYPLDAAVAAVDALDMDEIPFDARQARLAGEIATRAAGRALSLGDRACLALAGALGATAVTTDRLWARLDAGIAVELVR